MVPHPSHVKLWHCVVKIYCTHTAGALQRTVSNDYTAQDTTSVMWPVRFFVLVDPNILAMAGEGVPFLSPPDCVGTVQRRGEEGTLGRSRCNFICALTGQSSSYLSLAFKMKGAVESSGPAVPLTPGPGRERTGSSMRNIWSSRAVNRLHKIVNVLRGVVLVLVCLMPCGS